MKRYIEVFWTPFYNIEDAAFNILTVPPKPLFPILKDHRPNSIYLQCPAVTDYCKNEYVVFCPFDLVITIDRENQQVSIDRFGQAFFDKYILNRMHQTDVQSPAILSLPVKYLFYSNDSVELQIADLPIITSKSSENFKVIRAGFNIGKWVRPIELTVEVIDSSKPITMCAEDPLFLLKFKTPNEVPIKLTRVELTPELNTLSRSCTQLKKYRPKLKLAKLYELAEDYLELFKRKK